jgi:hypothetical protein
MDLEVNTFAHLVIVSRRISLPPFSRTSAPDYAERLECRCQPHRHRFCIARDTEVTISGRRLWLYKSGSDKAAAGTPNAPRSPARSFVVINWPLRPARWRPARRPAPPGARAR